jgi:hypothetical protein
MATHDTPEWREFERLVAGLEKQLAPRGAQIKSPDRIRDLVTERMREVDASIRVTRPDGSDELTTIECRKRGQRQDDVWIEQLASKRDKIGATRTIAVSSKGFTKSAVKSAAHFGILLRTATELQGEEFSRAILGLSMGATVTDYRAKVLAILDSDGNSVPLSDLRLLQADPPTHTPIAHDRITGAHVSLDVIAQRVGDRDVPIGGPPVRKRGAIKLQRGDWFVRSVSGDRAISAIEFVIVLVRYEVEATIGQVTDYSDGDKGVLRSISAEGRFADNSGFRIDTTHVHPDDMV